MRVFNKEKTIELFDYDLSKGFLIDDRLLVATHPAVLGSSGVWRHKTVNTYPNGGKDIKKVWDIPPVQPQKAYNEYERIKVFIPYV